MLLYGGGENGKSVILEMIQHLMPEHLCAAVRPDKFKEEYSKAQLAGAYVNIVGELERDKPLSSEFKDIVGGDQRQTARQPYCPAFTFQPRAAHVFASNHFPATRDHSHGFYRRWRIIKFNNVVDPKKKIPHLGKMIVEEEGQYLTAWALKGAQKLKKHGVNLPETVCHKEALQEWQNEQDTFKGFFADRETIEPKDGSNIPLAELFQEYQKWCSSNRRSSLGKQNFNKRVKQQFQTKRISNKNSLPDWCFVGESTLF
ncbi:MAG: hypothetical protein D3906_02910 [Candidatus Electrothrix sp. AUS1_2]|nr:hypothetical protein [Candidatus Electrothrix sp. AUS1_2]